MKQIKGYRILLLLPGFLLGACSGTKHLPEGERLYTGAEIVLEADHKIDERQIKQEVRKVVRPRPNSSIFGMRPKLWLYMAIGDEPSTRLGKWLRERGEAPVLLSDIRPLATSGIIDAGLFNMGIFDSHTQAEISENQRTANIIYTSYVHRPFKIGSIQYAISDQRIGEIIMEEQDNSFIQPGDNYNLSVLKRERMRIDAQLKNSGYFYFHPDYLLFRADTSATAFTVDFELTLKDSLPQEALDVYRIRRVVIDQDYSLQTGTEGREEILRHGEILFVGEEHEMKIRPEVIAESVFLNPGDIYTRKNHSITLNRLMSLGIFKFVQVKFANSDTTALGYLDVEILLTTSSNRALRAETELVSKSNNFTGPRMNLSLITRNAFHGAELINLSMAGYFESQWGGSEKNLFSYALNPQLELNFPRLLVPFPMKSSGNSYIPRTRMSLSYQYLKRVNYFDMNTFQLKYGYTWKRSARNEQEFNPLNISFTSISNQSEQFTALLESNPFLRKSYEEMFISGSNYSFTYNEQAVPNKRVQYYLHTKAETAGNLFSLANMVKGEQLIPEAPSTIAGSVYSQFARVSVDARGYYNFGNKNRLVMRFFGGVARPYGNSSILPYNKQFFSGGPNSIRAFRINSVGPGTYLQESENTGYFQLGGDIKLELNGEFRFTIYNFLKGALFVEAGNVWLHRSSPATSGTPFMISSFINELAVGAGAGVRIDLSFFVLRFDLAMPLRKPWLSEKERWVFNRVDMGSSLWRNENLVFNIAIGYPF
ncbi:MAG: BamA/TamA family outer membrane protein [Bacteroidales bacterium]